VDFVLDLLQGLGIAAGVGIRPFLPVVLVGALAAGDLGIDFDGTSFEFLEQAPFLIAILVLMALATIAMRRTNLDLPPWAWVMLGISLVAGALLAAGSLADEDYTVVPGIIGGLLAAALGFFAARSLFSRVRRRLDPEAQSVLPAYGEAAGMVAAGASVLFPPLAIVVIGALVWLLAGGRRRSGEKYAGLRILR
jgi:Na+-translocating ferredoxin:NAD+ oxidoreductase RnfA subunit